MRFQCIDATPTSGTPPALQRVGHSMAWRTSEKRARREENYLLREATTARRRRRSSRSRVSALECETSDDDEIATTLLWLASVTLGLFRKNPLRPAPGLGRRLD